MLWTLGELGPLSPGQPMILSVQEIFQPQSAYSPSQVWGIAVNRIAQNRCHAQAVVQRFLNQIAGDLRLGLKSHRAGDAHLFPTWHILYPNFRQINPSSHRGGHLPIADDQFDGDLTLSLFAHRTTILMADSDRVSSLLQPSGFVHDPRLQRFHHRDHLAADGLPHWPIWP